MSMRVSLDPDRAAGDTEHSLGWIQQAVLHRMSEHAPAVTSPVLPSLQMCSPVGNTAEACQLCS